jgi:hypothetical protein
MALTPEQQDLKTRCAQALQMGAGLARIDTHLANVGAGPAPLGVSKEQHLMDTLSVLAAGKKPAPVQAPAPKAVEPVAEPAVEPAAEPVAAEPAAEPAVEADAAEEAPKAKRRR